MQCTRCGAPLGAGATFCNSCGQAVPVATAAPPVWGGAPYTAAAAPVAETAQERQLRNHGLWFGAALVLCFFLPWVTGRGSTVFAWDLAGKMEGGGTAVVYYFLIGGGAAIGLAFARFDLRAKGAAYALLGLIPLILMITASFGKLGGAEAGALSGGKTGSLMLYFGLLALGFGCIHWAAYPGNVLAKGVAGAGMALLLLFYLVPLVDIGRGGKISMMSLVFKGLGESRMPGELKIILLFILMPIVACALAFPIFPHVGPEGPSNRTTMARVAANLALGFVPGFFFIIFFLALDKGHGVTVFLMLWLAIFVRAIFSWIVYGASAAIGPGPGAGAGAVAMQPRAPMGGYAPPPPPAAPTTPCTMCGAPARWVAQYQRWWCDRCQKYL